MTESRLAAILDAVPRSDDPHLRANQVEDVLVCGIVPIVAGHAYLGALLRALYVVHAGTSAWILVAGIVGAGLLGLRPSGPRGGVLTAVGSSSLLIAVIMLLPSWLGAVAIGAAAVTYAVALAREWIGGRGSSLFLVHIPVVAHVLLTIPGPAQTVIVTGALLVATGILIASSKYLFSASPLLGGMISTLLDSRFEGTALYLTVLVALLSAAVLFYERRLTGKAQSHFRRATGQALGASLLFVLAGLMTNWSPRWFVPAWAGLVTVYQGIQALRDRERDPVRLTWPVIAVLTAIWTTEGPLDWVVRTALTSVAIALVDVIALRARHRYLAVLASLLLAVPATVTVTRAQQDVFDWRLVLLQSIVTLQLITAASAPPDWRRAHVWWRGFISKPHALMVRGFAHGAVEKLKSLPVVGWLVTAVRTAVESLRYIRTGRRASFTDLLFVIAHGYGAWSLSGQVQAYVVALGAAHHLAVLVGGVVWVAWGFALLLWGESGDDLLSRYLGLGIVCVPVATEVSFTGDWTDRFQLALVLATAAALTLFGALRMRRLDRRAAEHVRRRAVSGGEMTG